MRAEVKVAGDFRRGTNHQCDLNLQQLREQVGSLKPILTSWHGSTSSYTPAKLQTAEFVFIRRDTPLQCIYEGPFKVLETGA